jgi:hypothetical protein
VIDRARVHLLVDELLDELGAPPAPTSLKERTARARPRAAKLRTPRAPYRPKNAPSELDVARARALGKRIGILRP